MKSIGRLVDPLVPSSLKRLIKEPLDVRHDKASTPYWYREAVGGMWEEIGKLQLDFLVRQGLRPEHYLLDIGCGSLRGGIHFIRYLNPGHYYGIDINQELLDAGRLELQQNDLEHKKPRLVRMGDFEFSSLGQEFDYALAQSVFTHLPLNRIIRCIMNVESVLVRGGQFYATFFENPQGKFNLEPVMHPCVDGPDIATCFDRNPYHYDFDTFRWICEETGLRVEHIGYWGHPRDQRMMVFINGD